ncbi:hypothetical protein [Dongia deserti]|uniref:hypothetical protein n=1 Tax=Dongia deserti TaxID=2268030 RepID=UPI000E654F03|nr:hypothetical protein [Dongia deserti]
MTSRRPLFYRKEKPRSISKTGLLLCLLLAGGVMLVPVGGHVVQAAKVKLRDYALRSGLIDFSDCVVTPEHALACSSNAAGTPLPVALRQIEDSRADAAAAREQRLKAERKVRELVMDVERLTAQLRRAELAAGAGSPFSSLKGDVRPTGFAVTNPSTGSMMNTVTGPQPEAAQQADPAFSPPAEED